MEPKTPLHAIQLNLEDPRVPANPGNQLTAYQALGPGPWCRALRLRPHLGIPDRIEAGGMKVHHVVGYIGPHDAAVEGVLTRTDEALVATPARRRRRTWKLSVGRDVEAHAEPFRDLGDHVVEVEKDSLQLGRHGPLPVEYERRGRIRVIDHAHQPPIVHTDVDLI